MDITTTTNMQYLSGHHSILGPSRFSPFQRSSWGGPIFNFFGGGLYNRPMMPGPSIFGYGGGMSNQTVIVNNGRSGFWGGLADVLEGFTRGLASGSWMFGGGMGMGMPMGGMYPGMPIAQVPQEQPQEADPESAKEYENLKDFGAVKGYTKINPDPHHKGEYTAFNPKTGDHITGDYDTVMHRIFGDKDDLANAGNDDGNDAGDDAGDAADEA